ncbi:MAG: hypothetical protein NC252_12135, partial [Roseburia sp.]|nr:hypothetical protein [Roseburia sp.]MCM1421971.1 hypothetical protein [Bacteroides sp.]
STHPILTQTMRFTSKTAHFSLKMHLIDYQQLINKTFKNQTPSQSREPPEMLKRTFFPNYQNVKQQKETPQEHPYLKIKL